VLVLAYPRECSGGTSNVHDREAARVRSVSCTSQDFRQIRAKERAQLPPRVGPSVATAKRIGHSGCVMDLIQARARRFVPDEPAQNRRAPRNGPPNRYCLRRRFSIASFVLTSDAAFPSQRQEFPNRQHIDRCTNASTARHCPRIALGVKHIFSSQHFVERDYLQKARSNDPRANFAARFRQRNRRMRVAPRTIVRRFASVA
jgi:hypothetical protein